jgi:hypothetical protein
MRFSLRTTVTMLAIFALLTMAAVEAAAQQPADDPAAKPTPRLPDGHPDLNGFWMIGRGPDSPVNSEFGPRNNPNIKRGDARNAAAQYADPNQPPYKPELKAKVADLAKNESKVDTAFFCKPGGVPRIGPPHSIVQAPGMPIVFLYELVAGNTFRLVPTDGRPHDPNAEDLYYGNSIGHWEGDTLVVDTIGFNDETWIGIYGWFHSSKLHVIERISRVGDTLHYQATVEDSEVFTRPWTMNPWVSVRTDKELIMENPPCMDTDSEHLTTLDEKTKQ